MGKKWTPEEVLLLRTYIEEDGLLFKEAAQKLNRPLSSVMGKAYKESMAANHVPRSTMPTYDRAEKTNGDVLILPDVEVPFQNADFINRAIDHALKQGVKTAILAGDFLHFEHLSGFSGDFATKTTKASNQLNDFIDALPQEFKVKGIDLLDQLGINKSLPQELSDGKRVVQGINDAFDNIIYIMGNHEQRLVRKIETSFDTLGVLDLITPDGMSQSKWTVSGYYYCEVDTPLGTWSIEHPRSSGVRAALDLAIQKHKHIAMGHSHRWAMQKDPSGRFYAIQMGHCVDESRLAYVMQRSAKRDAHALGALLLRDGVPVLLDENNVKG